MSAGETEEGLRGDVERCLRRRMRMAMDAGGMDASALARACGTKTAYVNRWLTGVRVPSAVNLRALSLALGVPTDWLLGAAPVEMLDTLYSLPVRILNGKGAADGHHGDDRG